MNDTQHPEAKENVPRKDEFQNFWENVQGIVEYNKKPRGTQKSRRKFYLACGKGA